MDLNIQYRKYPKSLRNWDKLLTDDNIKLLDKIIKYLIRIQDKYIIYPKKENIFRVFREVRPEDVKVVIIGQEPYYDGNATGLAFDSSESNLYLDAIREAIKLNFPVNNEIGDNRIDKSNNIDYLSTEGVLLLNTILTVEKDTPLSHSGIGWQQFIGSILKELSNSKYRVVYMLWGISAQQFRYYINEEKNLVLTYHHPSYSIRTNQKWTCDHFKRCNMYLKINNKKPINWI